jgi:hypothetical protein
MNILLNLTVVYELEERQRDGEEQYHENLINEHMTRDGEWDLQIRDDMV